MLTGKALFNTVVTELNDMGLPGMSATLDEMFRSPDFIHLDPLMAIAKLVEPEYQKKINKRIQSRHALRIFVAARRSSPVALIQPTGNTSPEELLKLSHLWISFHLA